MACLDENQVVALAAGHMSGEALHAAQEHLDECLDCLDLVGMFQRSLAEPTEDQSHDRVPPPLTESLQIDLAALDGMCIGRYEVLSLLGRGGMGVVYLARDPKLDRRVALKLVRPSLQDDERAEHFERRLMREARAMARLSHPNVLTIFDVGKHEDQVFLASAWIDGCTLMEWMERGDHGWRSVVRRFAAAARGLAAAHKAGLIHRDFKPSNVMIGPDERVYVFDFGLVKALKPSAEDITTQLSGHFVVGTPAYMSPEQMVGDVADEKSDQFSFCVALYEALAQRRPFYGRNVTALLREIGAGKVEVPKNIPKWLGDLLRRGMHRDPAHRHESMEVVVALLSRGIRRSYRRPLLIAGGLGVAVIAAAALAYSGVGVSPRDASLSTAPEKVVSAKRNEMRSVDRPEYERLEALLAKSEYTQVVDGTKALLPQVARHRSSEALVGDLLGRAEHALGHHAQAAFAFEASFYAAVAAKDDSRAALVAAAVYQEYAVFLKESRPARQWRDLAASAVERAGTASTRASWLCIEGQVALLDESITLASEKFSESQKVIESAHIESTALLAPALLGSSACLKRQGKLEEAMLAAQQALALWQDSSNVRSTERAMAQVFLAGILETRGQGEEAYSLAETALGTFLLHKRSAPQMRAMALLRMAQNNANLKEALQQGRQAASLFKEAGAPWGKEYVSARRWLKKHAD